MILTHILINSYGVEDAEYAISQLAQTTMRSEIGQLTLDHVLKERAALNTNITQAINEASQAWGVVCLRYEIRDIHAPEGVVAAMHRQVTAERSKRAEILESEGQRQSAINIAEGRKQSVILASEALKAEQINTANGEAQAILMKAQATASGIDAVARSIADGQQSAQGAVSLSVAEKYVDAFGKLAKEGTAVVVPGNVGDIGGMIATAMSVYGKINENQTMRNMSGSHHDGNNSSESREHSQMLTHGGSNSGNGNEGSGGSGTDHLQTANSSSSGAGRHQRNREQARQASQSAGMDQTYAAAAKASDMAKSVLESFEQTRRKR